MRDVFVKNRVSTTIDDFVGRQAFTTVFGELTVAQRRDDISVQFQFNLSDFDVVTANTGTGTTSQATSAGQVSTGTGVGSATITSRNALRYRPGHEAVIMFTQEWAAPEIGVNQYHGLWESNEKDGFVFKYEGTTFGLSVFDSGTEDFVPQSDWNVDRVGADSNSKYNPSGFKLNHQNGNIYLITFGWLGIAPAFFYVYGGAIHGWILVHIYEFANISPLPSIVNPSLPIVMKIERAAGSGGNLTMRSSSWRAAVVGEADEDNTSDRYFFNFIENKNIPGGTLTPLVSFQSQATFQTIENDIRTRLETVSVANDGTKAVRYKVFRNPTLVGSSFVADDATNSVNYIDVSATSYAATGQLIGGTTLARVASERIDLNLKSIGLEWFRNEILSIAAESVNSSDIDLGVRRTEEF